MQIASYHRNFLENCAIVEHFLKNCATEEHEFFFAKSIHMG